MRIMKRAFVSGFACAVAAGAMVSFAQDDLDSLLSDLESDGKKKSAPAAVKPAEKVAPQPAAEEVKPVEAVPVSMPYIIRNCSSGYSGNSFLAQATPGTAAPHHCS